MHNVKCLSRSSIIISVVLVFSPIKRIFAICKCFVLNKVVYEYLRYVVIKQGKFLDAQCKMSFTEPYNYIGSFSIQSNKKKHILKSLSLINCN